MNRLIDKLLEKDIVVQILSVLLAILVWFTVMDSENPFLERTISVPLRTNQEVLAEKNLEIVGSPIPASVDITIRGRKKRVERVSPNDFDAFLDFSKIKDVSETSVNLDHIKYTGKQDVLIKDINPREIPIKLERIIKKEFPVELKFTGIPEKGYSIVNKIIKPQTVVLEDRESLIKKVDRLRVSVDINQQTDTHNIYKSIEILDISGKLIVGFKNTYQASVSYDYAKEVPLDISVIGTPAKGFYLNKVFLNTKTIQIISKIEVLKNIKSIPAKDIDITGKSADFQEIVSLKLPKEVALFDDKDKIIVSIDLEPYKYKTVTVNKNSLIILGAENDSGLVYSVDKPLKITVKGKKEDIDSLNLSTVKCFLDVRSYVNTGEYSVPVNVSVPQNLEVVGSYKVLLKVKKEEAGLSSEK